jgi:cobyrinic acid a,c-diamide synthase
MPAFMIAAAHKSSGKTVISTGLAAALHKRGQCVQSFKKGPDYIDPMWLAAASGRACYNLDFNTMDTGELTGFFAGKSAGADLSMVEANKGLYDGVDLAGCDSNAHLAKLLHLPVILVIDTLGMTRGIAPLLLGYQAFDRDVNIAGLILNKVGGARHEGKLRAAVEAFTDIPVLGAVWRHSALNIGERHLGLTTPAETGQLEAMIAGFGQIVADAVDLDRLAQIANTAPDLPADRSPRPAPAAKDLRIGIARDTAFGFYYPDDLEAFADAGAQLVPIDTLQDRHLPDLDGLFIGGGFPEARMAELSANHSLRHDIKSAIEAGLPTYAECGGLMYLCQSLHWQGDSHPMVGVIGGRAVMHDRPQGRGYARYETAPAHPWGQWSGAFAAHEFHYASIEGLAPGTGFARRICRGHGVDGQNDGLVLHNLLAGFCHLRHTEKNPWAHRFLEFVRSHKAGKK